ncbi:flocculation protein FLO11-like [Anopheles stephensi]|uniref:flocculation protein FLO11-like n=1 Tax=Anopheles stephensi TaxID=30069 RepID=UPI0016588039|nr:flocculation protein FLO11-like [Anopheles stephensi]
MTLAAYVHLILFRNRKRASVLVGVLLLALGISILTNGSFEGSHCDRSEEISAPLENKVTFKENVESGWKASEDGEQQWMQSVVRRRRQSYRLAVLNDKSAAHVYQQDNSETQAKPASVVSVAQSDNTKAAGTPNQATVVQQQSATQGTNVGLLNDGSYARVAQLPINRPSEGQQMNGALLHDGSQGMGRIVPAGAKRDGSIWASLFPRHGDGAGMYDANTNGKQSDSVKSYFHPTNKPMQNCYCPYPLRAKNKLCYHSVTCFPTTTTARASSTTTASTSTASTLTTTSTTPTTTDSTTTDSTTTDSTTTESTTTESTTTESTTTESTTTESTTTESTTTESTTTESTTTESTTTESTTTESTTTESTTTESTTTESTTTESTTTESTTTESTTTESTTT